MADKTIGQLTPASQVTPTDLFVLEQSGTAKKLTGQILENWLVSFADGHGGIQTIEKTGTSGLTDTYTITLADTTTMTFTVTNGKGIQSIATYWAVSSNGTTPPTNWSLTRQSMTSTNRYLWSHQTITFNDGSIVNTTSSVVGVYGDKGNKGDTGNGIANLAQTSRVAGQYTVYTFTMTDGSTKSFYSYDGAGISNIERTSSAGLVDTYTITLTNGETDTFTITNAKSITSVAMVSGTHAPGTTDTYRITFNDGDTTDFTVYNGTNGTGSVSAVDGIQAVSQNVQLLLTGNGAPTASTVGQLNQRYFDLTSHILYICTAIDTSGAEATYTWAGTGVPVDSALSTMSENPVQNKAIANRFGTIETTLASKFPYSGGTMNGNIVMANHKITNLGAPTANGDAVNKSYVDSIISVSDTQLEALAGSLATIESSPATAAHTVGEYIVYNGQLYKVTAAIAAGQTLTVGTNIEVITVATAIKNTIPTVTYGERNTTNTSAGTIIHTTMGKIVLLQISLLKIVNTAAETVLASGLPASTFNLPFTLSDISASIRVGIFGNGQLKIWWGNTSVSTTAEFSGFVLYQTT